MWNKLTKQGLQPINPNGHSSPWFQPRVLKRFARFVVLINCILVSYDSIPVDNCVDN
jgi:hypothetical protein